MTECMHMMKMVKLLNSSSSQLLTGIGYMEKCKRTSKQKTDLSSRPILVNPISCTELNKISLESQFACSGMRLHVLKHIVKCHEGADGFPSTETDGSAKMTAVHLHHTEISISGTLPQKDAMGGCSRKSISALTLKGNI